MTMGDTASTPRKPATEKAGLAATAASVTKKILGASAEKPSTVLMPRAVAELHVSTDEIIPAGTIITEELAIEAGLDEDDLADLEDAGHVTLVEVHVTTTGSSEG
jgi:hypothetical protein